MTGPTDIEIERAVEALNNNHWHIVADMMLALKARAKAAEKREAVLLEAVDPFIAFAALPSFDKLPDGTPMTNGSRLAAKQITAGDFKRLRRAALGT